MKAPVLTGTGIVVECRPLYSKADKATPWAYIVAVGYVGGSVPLRLSKDEAGLFAQCQKFERDGIEVTYTARPEADFRGETHYRISAIGPLPASGSNKAA